MLIALAAAALTSLPAEPVKAVETTARLSCPSGVIDTRSPSARYDRGGPDAGAVDREPYRGEITIYHALERKIDGCSVPVVRVQRSAAAPVGKQVAPIER